MQVAHFLDAELLPWATALAEALFSPSVHALQPDSRAAQASEETWGHLDALAPLGDAIDTVLRASRRPLLEQLLLTPAEWRPAVISSHTIADKLTLTGAEAAACRDDMHAVCGVQTFTLNLQASAAADSGAVATSEQQRACSAAAAMPTLRVLEVRGRIGTAGAASLSARATLSRLSLLEGLGLGSNDVGAGGAAALAGPLGHLTALTLLGLNDNGVGAKGAASLAPALRQLSQLVLLDLDNTAVGAGGAAALAGPLSHLTALTWLALVNNDIGAAGAASLAPALANLSRLAELHLAGNNVGCSGATALAPALGRLPALTLLAIKRNGIGNAGVLPLARVPALRRLRLSPQ